MAKSLSDTDEEDEEEESSPVIIDCGSSMCKGSFADESSLRCIFPSIIKRPRVRSVMVGMRTREIYVGDEVQIRRRNVLVEKYPIQRGLITNWEEMEAIWRHTFYNELRISPADYPVFIVEKPLNPKTQREKIVETMFVKFYASRIFMKDSISLSLWAEKEETGIVLESGHEVTYCAAVYMGYLLPHTLQESKLGGKHVTEYLTHLLDEDGYSLRTRYEKEIVRDIKEKNGFVVEDTGAMRKNTRDHRGTERYEMPDGSLINLGDTCFQCTECLFDPRLVDMKEPGLQHILNKCIDLVNPRCAADFLHCVVFSGGNSMFPGLKERFKKELLSLGTLEDNLLFKSTQHSKYATSYGAKKFIKKNSNSNFWITREEYRNLGPKIVHFKLGKNLMSVGIKVCVRCRPFVEKDKLGVKFSNTNEAGESKGEVELLASKYKTQRFGFSYCWWSAYGYEKYLDENERELAKSFTLVNQNFAFESCGKTILQDILAGKPVVLFAYGLSGSGKTFTVFGPDDPQNKSAWFYSRIPDPLWGLFPRVAYDLFTRKRESEGWKISIKYFQNVVDSIRDLLSPFAREANYKTGMKKDSEGFIDIKWCETHTLNNFTDLLEAIKHANRRKAIAATQFNHQSTRGHCILVLLIEFPHPEKPDYKIKGRVYVCDLAGTEPAADIVHASYKKIVHDSGDVEYKCLGQHKDQSKTRQLQDQGKKINLSLSEMAQFFMKMAKAVESKKLAAGQSIPGCTSYFLCKFLKDTMLQAKTYLFCAIRPEAKFHRYTFSTLGFASNASIIKVKPKKATVAQTKKEIELLRQLQEMKNEMELLRQQGSTPAVDVEELLLEKQEELRKELQGEQDIETKLKNEEMRSTLGKRGVYLAEFETTASLQKSGPYMINVDEDSFRHMRYIYKLKQGENVFGRRKGCVQTMSLFLVDDHCSVTRENELFHIRPGKGEVFHNGLALREKTLLNEGDRVVIGQEMLLFVTNPQIECYRAVNTRKIVAEYVRGKGDGSENTQNVKLLSEKKKLEEEVKKLRQEGESKEKLRQKEHEAAQWSVIDDSLRHILPTISTFKHLCQLTKRDFLDFKPCIQTSVNNIPSVKIEVSMRTASVCSVVFLDPFEIRSNLSFFQDEVQRLKSVDVAAGGSYEIPKEADIVQCLFDTSYHFGTATSFLMHCALNMETDPGDFQVDIMKSVAPYEKVGEVEVSWRTVGEEVIDPMALLGKSWIYTLHIGKVSKLSTKVSQIYIEYEFNGEKYLTECIEVNDKAGSRNVKMDYSCVHEVHEVFNDFLTYLDQTEFKLHVYIKPWVEVIELEPISTADPEICIGLGIKGIITREENLPVDEVLFLQKENVELKQLLEERDAEILQLKAELITLQTQCQSPRKVQQLIDAKELDNRISG
eukprot:maker-scaffold_42-snap-gene-0.53-mRNA-1 protein AED:0.04 eAED:0.04 QI:0/0/0/0.66/0.8/0.66/6/0/1391